MTEACFMEAQAAALEVFEASGSEYAAAQAAYSVFLTHEGAGDATESVLQSVAWRIVPSVRF